MGLSADCLAMERMSLEDFESRAAEYDAVVAATPEILHFCSASAWQLAAHRRLYPRRDTIILKRDDNWQVWAVGQLYQFRTVLQPLEADWFFGCPVVGANPRSAAGFLFDALDELSALYPFVWLGGVPTESLLHKLVLTRFRKRFRLFSLPGCDCQVASLTDGLEAYLSRRSSRFRNRLRRVERDAEDHGIEVEYIRNVDRPRAVLRRMVQVENRSWKAYAGESIFGRERFRRFYLDLVERLARQRRFRALVLKQGRKDIAFAMGGLLGGRYRGFQMSYDRVYERWSPGHLSQIRLIRELCAEGAIEYDLGMVMEYKARWSDAVRPVTNVLLMRR